MNLDKYKDPITTETDIDDLHHVLVKTVLDFMKERKLTDIDEIHFSADGLSYSYAKNTWTPATDSSLCLIGIQNDDEFHCPVRKIIGSSM